MLLVRFYASNRINLATSSIVKQVSKDIDGVECQVEVNRERDIPFVLGVLTYVPDRLPA